MLSAPAAGSSGGYRAGSRPDAPAVPPDRTPGPTRGSGMSATSRGVEEYDRTGSTRHAVTEGLGRTGRLVTSAALILFLAFASLASAPDTDIKVFATALGAGILLDATVIRALLVPATVALFGRWNWWLPGPLAKIFPARPAADSKVSSSVRQATHEQVPAGVPRQRR